MKGYLVARVSVFLELLQASVVKNGRLSSVRVVCFHDTGGFMTKVHACVFVFSHELAFCDIYWL